MASGFKGLKVYQQARELRKRIYKLTRLLPAEEKRNLFSQMRRASLSVTNNIAEGHGSRSYKHNISYLYRSRGSLDELLDDVTLCEDEAYFKKDHLDDLERHIEEVVKLLNGYVAYLRKKADGSGEAETS